MSLGRASVVWALLLVASQMSAVVLEAVCRCASIGEDAAKVRFCAECHRYWRGDKQLTSVSKVLRTIWPLKPDFSRADPAVIENARDRGVVTDALFSLYVKGGLDRIPKGTRQDSVELFFKVRRWWDNRKHGQVESQVILADSEVAGTCDVKDDDEIYDLKCTHDIEDTYPLQLAAYGELHFSTYQRPVKSLNIIHCTKRYAEPKIIKVDLAQTIEDWALVRQMWRMVSKRSNGKLN